MAGFRRDGHIYYHNLVHVWDIYVCVCTGLLYYCMYHAYMLTAHVLLL